MYFASVPIFKSLPEETLIKISDVLEETFYQQGDYIVSSLQKLYILFLWSITMSFYWIPSKLCYYSPILYHKSLLIFLKKCRFDKEHAATHFSSYQKVEFVLRSANKIPRRKNSFAFWAKAISSARRHCKGKRHAKKEKNHRMNIILSMRNKIRWQK